MSRGWSGAVAAALAALWVVPAAYAAPVDFDCLLGGADAARVTSDGMVILTRRGVETARGRVGLPFPFDEEAGGIACSKDRLTVFAMGPGGRGVLVHLRLDGGALVPMDAAEVGPTPERPDGAALCRAGRYADGIPVLRAEAAAAGAAPEPWLLLGDCLWDAGSKGEARDAYLEFARRAPRRTWPAALSRRCPECEPRP